MKLSTALEIVSFFVLSEAAAQAEAEANPSTTTPLPPLVTHLSPIVNEDGNTTFPVIPDGQIGTLNNFRASCDVPWLNTRYYSLLHSNCYTRGGVLRLTHIDLNLCLVNQCGALVPAKE
jgi:hypothetical protein